MESYEATAVMSRPSSMHERPSTSGDGTSDNYLSSRESPDRGTTSRPRIKLLEFVESLQDFANDETNYLAEVERAKLKKTKSEKETMEDAVGRLTLDWKDRMSQMPASKVNQDNINNIEPIKSRSSINTPISIPTTPVKPLNQPSNIERPATPEERNEIVEEQEEMEYEEREEEEVEEEEEEEDRESYVTPSHGDEISQSPRRLEITLTPRSIEPQEDDNDDEGMQYQQQHHQEELDRNMNVEGIEEVDEEMMMMMENVRRVESLSSVKTRARSKRRKTNTGGAKTRRKNSTVRPAANQNQDNLQQQQQQQQQQHQQQVGQTAKAKRKKLHGRLRNSNSKSTVTTRDTSFSETRKTERKKLKRHKSLDTISVFRGAQSRKRASGSSLRARESKQTTSKDIYELYQNSASKRESALLQASIESSRISTAASAAMTAARNSPRNASAAMGYRAKRAARAAAKAIYEDKIQDRDIVVELHRECEGDDEEDQSSMTRVGAPAERFEEGDNIEMHEEPTEQTNCCAMHSIDDGCEEHDHPVIEVYPPVENTVIGAGDTRRETKYDQPTESSKMKQVQRPYRFHVSHIPFVVGTSLSPSHNLGLNIQQVLSLIKVKQPAIPSISPMLIRKVSKGIRPLSSLFEYINGQYGPRPSRCSVNFPIGSDGEHQVRSSSLDVRRAFSSFSCTDQTRTAPKSVPSTTNQSSFKQNLQNINCEPLYEEDEESVYSDAQTGLQSGKVKSLESSSKWESKSFVSNRQSRESHKSKLQATLGDTQETIPQNSDNPDNHEQFIEVFSRLYDQYSMMLAKLDKINGQLETKRNDKLLQREADELQDATNAKCQEVEAMIKLYKEVMSLKQQMRQLHERNSFVCITEDGATSRPFYSDSRQDWSQTRNRSMTEAPNALRLAGLLKQIQAFQRQLALV